MVDRITAEGDQRQGGHGAELRSRASIVGLVDPGALDSGAGT